MASMRLKDLEWSLQDVKSFTAPKIELEQYPTSPHLAANIIFTAQQSFRDIEGKCVLDLGCGCGILGIGASLLDAGTVTCVDIDHDAIEIAKQNIEAFEMGIDIIQADVSNLGYIFGGKCSLIDVKSDKPTSHRKVFDTVVMNPPFGTRNSGIDMVFLKVAMTLCSGSVYSLHKSSTRDHVLKKALDWGGKPRALAKLRFDVSNIYKFHKKQSADIEVDLIRIDMK